jgi:Ca2+-binding RTX toxin-like protein
MIMATPVFGDDGKNTIKGGIGGDVIFGMGDSDVLNGGFGADMLYGGAGNDKLYGEQNDDFLDGDIGNDLIEGGSGADTLMGGAGKDSLNGGAGDDVVLAPDLSGLAGDVIVGGDGVDTLQLIISTTGDRISFAAGDPLDTAKFGGASIKGLEVYQIFAGSGADKISGYVLSDALDGGKGNDTLSGLGGADFLSGGDGVDKLYGGNQSDYIHGGAGADTLLGENGADFMEGASGGDNLQGGSGDDVMSSASSMPDDDEDPTGSGVPTDGIVRALQADDLGDMLQSTDVGSEKDALDGGTGADTILMGIGDSADGGNDKAGIVDTVAVNFTASRIGESFTFSDTSNEMKNGAAFERFEQLNFLGGSGSDKVTGGSRSDTLDGAAGADTMSGAGGDDALLDSRGKDLLAGGNGNDSFYVSQESMDADRFNGDAGSDTVYFGETDGISAYLDLADQKNNDGLIKGDRFTDIELFVGTEFDDTMLGSSGSDHFAGAESDDVLSGAGGDDRLDGGSGADLFTGGSGKDVFDLGGNDLYAGWKGDRITDFTRGQDRLTISLEEFGFSSARDFKLVSGESPDSKVGDTTFLFDTETHQLWWDADGTGGQHDPLLIATLAKVGDLAVADFILI